ncbi:MAG: PD-(D/E)XK nuclease family protein [Chloroflexi bacterium]|nr:PD-(D/E)XK nuclease family protein [Chloroflexota bacterium]
MGGLFRISHSKVQSFDRCRKQYWYRHVSGLEPPAPPPPTPPGVIGTGVHRAMKFLCQTGDADDGRNELDAYLRMPAHECAGPGTEAYAAAFQMFENGCQAHDTIIAQRSWAELDTWIARPGDGVTLQARIDRADRLGPLAWQVIDWKTGRWDMDEIVDAQLDLGHVVVRVTKQLPAAAEVTAIAWNLRNGRRRIRALRRSDAVATIRRFVGIARRIQETTEFEATPSGACGFCEWRPQCPDAARAEAGEIEWLEDDEPELPAGASEEDIPAELP